MGDYSKFRSLLIVWVLAFGLLTARTRKELRLPDIDGYKTLVGDFHMHTLFSDGNVWPTTRVEEAYREGLDVISITDHVEYKAYAEDVPVNYGRSYEIALPKAKELGILLIKGAEITRSMPPGHLNALFIKDIEPLTHDDPMTAIEIAANQGAYILWNHPGWSAQLKEDGIVRWYDEHTELFEKGWLKGIEIVNEKEYYPEVHQWALEKNLTFFGNSDVHSPIDYLYEPMKGEHRPYTLVFAKEKSLAGVREALENRRTIIYHEEKIIGKEELLTPFLAGCLENDNPMLTPGNSGHVRISLGNNSVIPLYLIPDESAEITISGKVLIRPGTSERVRLNIPTKYRKGYQKIDLAFKVENFLVEPEKCLKSSAGLELLNIANIGLKIGKKDKYEFTLPELPPEISMKFTTDGSCPAAQSADMRKNAELENTAKVRYCAFKNGQPVSDVYTRDFTLHKGMKAGVRLKTQPQDKYYEAGAVSLIDGLTGKEDYADGNWLGFERNDLEAELVFDKPEEIKEIEVRFLEKNRSWIFMPQRVKIEVSEKGNDFVEIFTWTDKPQTENAPAAIIPLIAKNKGKVEKIRITAKNRETCPDWHSGAGGDAWLFVDEIIVR